MATSESRRVHPLIDRLGAYSWRIVGIAVVVYGISWLVGKMWIVFLPLVLAAFLSRALIGPTNWLRHRGWRPGVAAAVVLLSFLLGVIGVSTLVGVAVGRQASEIGPTVTHAVDDIETWLVTDAPGNLSKADVRKARADAGKAAGRWVRTSGGTLVSGAVVFFQVIFSMFIGLIITFFALKDGSRLGEWALHLLPEERRPHTSRLSDKAWATLGGYLRGATLLGLLEGTIIGITMTLVGADLAIPIAVITFMMAFVPFVGAIIAGVLAILIALATAGTTGALIVLAVAVLVQQFDNDLLAPVIYGKALDIHPVTVLLSISAGGALFGLAGTFLAVPVAALVLNVIAEHRQALEELQLANDGGGGLAHVATDGDSSLTGATNPDRDEGISHDD